jgi:hypothetical protein
MKKWMRSIFSLLPVSCLLPVWFLLPAWPAGRAQGEPGPSQANLIRGGNLSVEALDDGFYALRSTTIPGDVLRSEVEADMATGTLRSSLYPRHLSTGLIRRCAWVGTAIDGDPYRPARHARSGLRVSRV